jgi:membrane-bound inhibitor of C-type lysozyme
LPISTPNWKRQRKPFGFFEAAFPRRWKDDRPFRSGLYTRLPHGYCTPCVPADLIRGEAMQAGANMTWCKTAIFGAALSVTSAVTGPSTGHAQTFESYRCADGTRFIVGFYQYDSRAYLQIDGRAVTLTKRLALSGARYSGGGVTLAIAKAGATIKHVKRPLTSCELT